MLMLAALFGFLASLVPLLQEVLGYLRVRGVCWWQPPTGVTSELLQDLEQMTQKQYHGALSELHQWTTQNGIAIRSIPDLNKAAYGYLPTVTRHKERTTIAALYKAYPTTCGSVPWALARAEAGLALVPVEHHPAMPGMLALTLAWATVSMSYPSRALLIDSYPVLNSMYRLAAKRIGVNAKWTPHRPRSSWAGWRWACGQSFPDLRKVGRWTSDASLRVYFDQIGVDGHFKMPDLVN